MAACFDSTGSEGESVRRYWVADTLVVENLQPTRPDTLVPVLVQRYGLSEGPPEYLFGEIYSFAVAQDGSVFVFDQTDGIREYAVNGEYRGRLAKIGEGPGEVGYIVAMASAPDGRIAAVDLRNRRVAVFDRGGDSWTARLPEGRPAYRDGAVVLRDDGSLWVGINPLYPDQGGITHPRAIFVRIDRDGATSDTLKTPASIDEHCPTLSTWEHSRGFWEDNREPFLPKVKWALGPDGTYSVGCAATYRFYVYGRDGSVMRVARARHRVRVSQEELDFRAAMPVSKAEEVLPAYVKIRLPGDGRIWVWPSQPNVKVPVHPDVAAQYGVTHTWSIPWQGEFDVFSADGEWLAVVKLPSQARYSGFPTEPGVVIRGDTLWAVEQDSLDVRTIARYEVRGLE